MQRLLDGYARFRTEVFPHHSSLFAQLARGQKPEVCFITCSDSRVMPEMIFQCEPGQIFPIRTAGNLVPPPGESHSGVTATVEYAVKGLKVTDIVVCGHSGCGAMKEFLERKHVDELPAVHAWLRHAGPSSKWLRGLFEQAGDISPEKQLELLTQANILAQLNHLAQHSAVAEGLASGTLRLHGWIYDIATGEILSLDTDSGAFLPLSVEPEPALHIA
ncbi:carbonic anhydrase [Terriglobus tenax]|uniref:carbonic anhydrase n=1 Tax=Terriglobus tenax TaxID=1111115 RepID=UPI0021DF7339|nr:carbonic anhydrase [Terriglobus tenax]